MRGGNRQVSGIVMTRVVIRVAMSYQAPAPHALSDKLSKQSRLGKGSKCS